MTHKKIIKSRAFCFIVYPDSVMFKDWINELKSFHIDFFISPIHNKDKCADGTLKKPHYHVLLLFNNTTTVSKADYICNYIGGVREPNDERFAVSSISSYARYLIHRDDADKYQYNADDVISYGNVSYLEICEALSDERRAIKDIKSFIVSHRIISFALLSMYCDDNNAEWSYLLNTRYSYLIKEFIKSYKWTLESASINVVCSIDRIYDTETGEVIYSLFN